MNRREFVTGSLIASLLPSVVSASTPPPSPQASVNIGDYLPSNIEIPVQGVDCQYETPTSAQDQDSLWSLLCWGMQFDNQKAIEVYQLAFATALSKVVTAAYKSPVAAPVQTSVHKVGDETWAYSADREAGGSFAFIAVRKSTYLQMLFAGSYGTQTVSVLSDIAASIQKRWPNSDKEHQSGGQKAGGLWDILPTFADIPEGMTLVSEDATKG